MRLLGAEVIPVETGTGTLKDAVSAAMREWTNRITDTHYCLGSVIGPHPFPTIVRDFQAVISQEIKSQLMEKEGRLPDAVLACVGGGSNAIGAFYHFIEEKSVRLIGCEAAGRGVDTFETAATIATGRVGIFHGMKSYFCQDEYGQIAPVYSISAGLDYPGVGPEHAWLHDTGRAEYVPVTGVRSEITTDIGAMVKLVRENTSIPCAVGFGISTPEQAKKMADLSDGAIVGSAIVRLIAEHGKNTPKYVNEYVKSMKEGMGA